MSKKPMFIVPGYKHSPTSKAYKAIATMLKSEGYRPIPVAIPWKQTTISQNTEYFLKKYKKIHARKKYIIGFSFGAMIAFLASTKVNTSGLILCSLSPYFREDVKKTSINNISPMGKLQHQDFSKLKSSMLARQSKAKQTLLLYGARESKPLIRRVTKTYKQLVSTDKYLIQVRAADHNIGDKRYLQTIHQIAKQLN